MRWFKHMANARHDEFLKELRHEFGSQGIEAWWNLVEFVAESVKPSSPRPRVIATPRVFAEECYCDEETLEKVVRFATAVRPVAKLKFRKRATRLALRWSVEIPKVLVFRDEYTRKEGKEPKSNSGVDQEQVAQKEKKKESQKEKEKKSETRPVGAGEKPKAGKGSGADGGATLIQKAKAVVRMFQDEPTRIKILEWVGYLENEETVPDRRILDSMKQLWNLRESMIGDNGMPAGKIFRYAVEQTMKHKAKNADYTAKVIQNTIIKWRDGSF